MGVNLKHKLLWVSFLITIGMAFAAPNKYQKIANEFSISPPTLEWGYPLQYKWDDLPIKAIVYLSNQVTYLENLGQTVFLSTPNPKHASELEIMAKANVPFGKYYLVVDASVTVAELKTFLEVLGKNEFEMNVCLVGGHGKYVPITFHNESYFKGHYDLVVDENLDDLKVEIRENKEVLVEMENRTIPELSNVFMAHYGHNFSTDECLQCANKVALHPNSSLLNIKYLESQLEFTTNKSWLEEEILRWKRKLELTINHDSIFEMPARFQIHLDAQRGVSLNTYYTVMSSIQYGVFKARNTYAVNKWGASYGELVLMGFSDELEILDLTFPDRLKAVYNEKPYCAIPNSELFVLKEKIKVSPIMCVGEIYEEPEKSIPPFFIDEIEDDFIDSSPKEDTVYKDDPFFDADNQRD